MNTRKRWVCEHVCIILGYCVCVCVNVFELSLMKVAEVDLRENDGGL
jgi:hypothetical protein